jgi:hypothetical protein
MFKEHSWYFRNALVRANYRNMAKGIDPDISYLVLFFRNLMLGETSDQPDALLLPVNACKIFFHD